MINGNLTPVLLWLIAGLVGLVNVLFGLVLKMHVDRDDERWNSVNDEIQLLRTRLHDLSSVSGKVDQWQRFHDEDKK